MKQVGALPYQRNQQTGLQVLLVTSRATGRWVIPKGWRMKPLPDYKAAAKEALQEAGALGRVRKKPVGSYEYFKRARSEFNLVEVVVYLLEVDELLSKWPEMKERRRSWFSIDVAERLVREPGLLTILRQLSSNK